MKLKHYPKYKDSGIQWIGEIPDEWAVNKIKNTSYVKGRIGWQGLTSEEYSNDGAYLVTGTNFKKGMVDWATCHHVGLDRYKEDPYIHLKEADLLITKDGTIGKIVLIDKLPDKATLNSGIFLVRPLNHKYQTRFMYWILNSLIFERFFEYIKTGATILHLYQETFEKFFFPIPTAQEQITIASFLDKKTNQIDELITKNKKLIELEKEKRVALINHVVTKGLDPNAKMNDSGIEWIGKIPVGWKIAKLKHLTKQIIDGTHFTPTYIEEGIPFLRVTDIQSKKINPDEIKYISEKESIELNGRCNPKRGDVLLSKNGTIGIPKVVNWNFDFSIFVSLCLIKLEKKINPYFLKYFILSDIIKEQIYHRSKTTSVTNLHLDQIKEFVLTYPDDKEQSQIVRHLDHHIALIDKTVKKIEQNIDLLEEYRKSLIHHAVTGKVDVRGVEV